MCIVRTEYSKILHTIKKRSIREYALTSSSMSIVINTMGLYVCDVISMPFKADRLFSFPVVDVPLKLRV